MKKKTKLLGERVDMSFRVHARPTRNQRGDVTIERVGYRWRLYQWTDSQCSHVVAESVSRKLLTAARDALIKDGGR